MSSRSFFAHATMFSASFRFRWKMVVEMPKLKRYCFCSACIARIVSLALSNPRWTLRTTSWTLPMPSIDTRVLKITRRSWQSSTIFVNIGMARCGVRPVVLSPSLRSLGNLSSIRRAMSTRSFRVVGSPPEMLAFSIFFQSLELNARSISAIVRSLLRSPRFQLLHISQRASQTNVQWKIRTVGRIGRNCAI